MSEAKKYTIWATLGNDLEKIIEADFLDSNELTIVKSVIVPLFDRLDKQTALRESMSFEEWDNYQEDGGEIIFPFPFFVFDNEKHKDLIFYLTLAGIGFALPECEVPNVFNRTDSIILTGYRND